VRAAAPATPRQDATPRVYAQDEVDTPTRPVAPLEPAYPPRLRALGLEGEVETRVVVAADGRVRGARLVESTHPDFTASARAAIREARFEPARLDGRPVASWVTLRLRFRLEP
jgi:protein TonB